jgi:hypothetical protein
MIGLSDNISLAFLRTTFVKLYVENEFICLISDAEEFSAVRRDVSKKREDFFSSGQIDKIVRIFHSP